MKEKYTICFLPWITFKEDYEFNQTFLFRFPNSEKFDQDFSNYFLKILSRYKKIDGQPLSECTVVGVNSNKSPWNLVELDPAKVKEALDIFFLGAFSLNQYFSPSQKNINSSHFQSIYQDFTLPFDFTGPINIKNRRRDGDTFHFYGFENICFVPTIECSPVGQAPVISDKTWPVT